MAKIRDATSEHKGQRRFHFMCPGCNEVHAFNSTWTFNNDFDKPTVSPSILMRERGDTPRVCHSFIKEGMIQFLGDCTHKLAGKTVPLEDW